MTVDTRTGEITDRPSFGEVRESVELAKEHGAPFFEAILWQIENEAWTVLGYASWDVMRDAEYADMGVVVPRADRPEITARLRKRGLTQRQIATTLGVHEATVSRDLANARSPLPPTITNARGEQRPTSYAPRPLTLAPAEEGEAEAGAGLTDPSAERSLAEYLEQQSTVQDGKYLLEFFRTLNGATSLTGFDAERVGRLVDEIEMDAVSGFLDSLEQWVDQAKKSRTQLRVIGGGKR